MRKLYLAVVATAALAACQDAPTTTPAAADLYDMSKVTVLTPAQRAEKGIAQPSFQAPAGRASLALQPCIQYPDYYEPCGPIEPVEKPIAYYDYYTHIDTYGNGYSKWVDMWAYAQGHENIASLVLTISYRSVGGQGPSGCSATPAQFDSDYFTASGSPSDLRGSRYASYDAGMTFVWETYSTQKFTAVYGYSIDGYNRILTLPASHRVCH